MGKKQIYKVIKVFYDRVKKRFGPSRVYLCGSYAQGEATEHSDVDVVVVADSMDRVPKEKRFDELYALSADLTPDFHFFGLTSAEYQSISPYSTLADMKKHATLIR